MSRINVSDLSFTYDGAYSEIFSHVSFDIDTDWKLGFIGRNGRGKTTFLNLLLGKYTYSGSISANVSFAYFPFSVVDKEQLTIHALEDELKSIEIWQLVREMHYLKLDEELLYRPFSTLSNGEQTKIMLAALFLKDNTFLLIDEPTNHLDLDGRKSVAAYLNKKKGFILVSHDRYFLDACVDHILSINKQDIDIQKGNYSSFSENKKRQDDFELAQNEKLKQEIGHLEDASKRTSSWSDKIEATKKGQKVAGLKPDRGHIGHMAAKMMKRSKATERRRSDAVEQKSTLLKNIDTSDTLKLFPLTFHKNTLLSLKDVSLFYDDREVVSNISLQVQNGDRVNIKGSNGSGKTSLIKLIRSKPISHSGSIEVASGLKLSYVPQNTSGISGDLKEIAEKRGIEERLFKTLLRKLDLERAQFERDVSEYSEGQKKKVLLAASLCERAHLYIWDEPLNYIDVLSRIQVENLILTYKPTLLFIEHDESFCQTIATKTLVL